jgi:hypothetical protein
MATNLQGYLSLEASYQNSTRSDYSITSIDSGYESKTHIDKRGHHCTQCLKPLARRRDLWRHERRHREEKDFVCKGKLRQDSEWGCGRSFHRADILARHFRSEAGRICIKPLMDEEAIERQRRWQEQPTEHHISKKQELASAFPLYESGNYTLPAALLAQYPALATLSWIELPTMDDDCDGEPSKGSSLDTAAAEYYSNIDALLPTRQPSINGEISEELAAVSALKEPDTNTVLEADCIANISEKSEPKDLIEDNFEPTASPELVTLDQLVPSTKASIFSSAVSSNGEIDIKSKPLSDCAEPCTDVLTKVSEQSEEPAREPNPTSNYRRTEILPRDEVSGDDDYLSPTSSTDSDFEEDESPEAETTSSEGSSESSFISSVIEAYKREAVESLMTEFKTLLDHSLGIQSRAMSAGSPNSSSPPPSSAEQPSQQGVSGRGKRTERDEDGPDRLEMMEMMTDIRRSE